MQLTMTMSGDIEAVLADRRRPGRVDHASEHLTALLRAGATLSPPIACESYEFEIRAVIDRPARWPHGLLWTMVISFLLWGMILAGARSLLW